MNEHIKNRERFEFKTDPSNGYLIGPDGAHYKNPKQAMYYGQLKFCGCGDPVEAHKFAIEALSCFDRDKVGFAPGTGIDAIEELVSRNPSAAAYFIAYTLDKMNLTEHGGSVGGSWLTERGKQFLEVGPMSEEDDQ